MWVSRHRLLLIAGLFAGACGGSKNPPANSPSEAATPGEQCLADANATRKPPSDAPTSIEVSHILVRHKDLARPEGATRTRQEACLLALDALKGLESSGDWDQTVDKFSDSGKSTHGELGQVKRDELTGSFGDAAFSLDVNELSYVVESDRGFHVILRTR